MRVDFELENAWDSQRCINVRECILNEAKTTMNEHKIRNEYLCEMVGVGVSTKLFYQNTIMVLWCQQFLLLYT